MSDPIQVAGKRKRASTFPQLQFKPAVRSSIPSLLFLRFPAFPSPKSLSLAVSCTAGDTSCYSPPDFSYRQRGRSTFLFFLSSFLLFLLHGCLSLSLAIPSSSVDGLIPCIAILSTLFVKITIAVFSILVSVTRPVCRITQFPAPS